MSTRLVIVEGIPGSGKTSMARFVADSLLARGREVRLFLEGDLDQPADPESVACLTEGEYEALVAEFPAWRRVVDERVRTMGGDRLIGYRKLQTEVPDVPDGLVAALARHEVYELPPDRYRELLAAHWSAFAARAATADAVYVFECCFLQNPLTMLLARHDEPVEAAKAFVARLAEAIAPLDPLLVYLDPGPAGEVLRRVAEVRPPEWLEFVIWYHTQQGHGKTQGWQGFEGMVRFYEMRKAIELELVPALPLRSVVVRHSDWETDRRCVAQFLAAEAG